MLNTEFQSPTNYLVLRKFFKIVLILIPLALVGNIVYVVLTTSPEIFRNLEKIDSRYFVLAAVLTLLPWLGQSAGIIAWSRVFKVNLAPSRALDVVLASDIGAAITPTILGGGYVKLAFLVNYGFTAPQAALVMFLGGVADTVFFALALPAAVFWTRTWENPHIIKIWREITSHWPVVATIGIILIAILVFLKKIKTKHSPDRKPAHDSLFSTIRSAISKFKTDFIVALKFVRGNGKVVFLATVFYSGLGWCGRYGAVSALVVGLGYHVDPVLFFLLQWVVFTTMTMIPTPGAIGGAEVSFALIYDGLIPSSVIPLATAAWRFVTFYMTVGLASAIFAVFRMKKFSNVKKQGEIPVTEKTKIPR